MTLTKEMAFEAFQNALHTSAPPELTEEALFGPHGLLTMVSVEDRKELVQSKLCKDVIARITKNECEQASKLLRTALDFKESEPARRVEKQ